MVITSVWKNEAEGMSSHLKQSEMYFSLVSCDLGRDRKTKIVCERARERGGAVLYGISITLIVQQ